MCICIFGYVTYSIFYINFSPFTSIIKISKIAFYDSNVVIIMACYDLPVANCIQIIGVKMNM